MYTMQTYSDEVKLRMRRYFVSQELDPGTLQMLINRSRSEVQLSILPIFRERYVTFKRLSDVPGNAAVEILSERKTVRRYASAGNVTNTLHRMNLPVDYLEVEAVHYQANIESTASLREMRRVVRQEMSGVLSNTFTYPTPASPVYAVEKSPNSPQYNLLCSIGEDAVTPSKVIVYYVRAIAELELINGAGAPDVEFAIPEHLCHLVVVQAQMHALAKMNVQNVAEVVGIELESLVSDVEMEYNTAIDKSQLLLPSRNGQYPNTPLGNVPGNKLRE